MANNEVRIISGQWKGRKLRFPANQDLRPTLGRVRETLFNWLAPMIQGTRCLDLFAGSGALGFEALSRGAAEVTFVERDRKAALALQANAQQLHARSDSFRILNESASGYLSRSDLSRMPEPGNAGGFDIIFFDPPFGDRAAGKLLDRLLSEFLAPEGLLYLECPRRQPLPHAERQLKHATAGDCQFALLSAEPSHHN